VRGATPVVDVPVVGRCDRARPRKPKPPARASRATKNATTRLKASVPGMRARAEPNGRLHARSSCLDATRPNCRESLMLAPPRAHSARFLADSASHPGNSRGMVTARPDATMGHQQPSLRDARIDTFVSRAGDAKAPFRGTTVAGPRGRPRAYTPVSFPSEKNEDARSPRLPRGLKIPPRSKQSIRHFVRAKHCFSRERVSSARLSPFRR
jgi:hypothetical protein